MLNSMPLSFALAAAMTGTAVAGSIDPGLQRVLDDAAPDDRVSALLYLTDQVDATQMVAQFAALGATRAERSQTMIEALQELADESQARLLPALEGLAAAGGLTRVDPFWVANIVRIDGTPDAIRQAAQHPDIRRAYQNPSIGLVAPTFEVDGGGPLDGTVEPGVAAINAPAVWDLGYDGSGVLLATIDSGVDGSHPALASRWAGLLPAYDGHPEWAFFDPFTNDNDFPFDGASNSHGTHVMGTAVGGLPGDQIGVAPGAHWIACAAIDVGATAEETIADAIESFQWCMNPDGDPGTVFDVPHICSNSWGLTEFLGMPPCDDLFWSFLDNLEAGGTLVLFAGGNEGPSGLRRPADRATDDFRTLAVGAVDAGVAGFPVADFSSLGPTQCTEDQSSATKPDISAPGVAVRSAIAGGDYGLKDGTSMATPHIAGALALALDANPDLTVEQLKVLLYATSVDLGLPGKDNGYGHGMVDALALVQAALATPALTFTYDSVPALVDPSGGVAATVLVTGGSVPPAEDSGILHYRINGGPWATEPLIATGPDRYDVVFPAIECTSTVDWYLTVDRTDGTTAPNPYDAPANPYTSLVFSGFDIALDDDFETDQGWLVENVELEDGQWDRGIPAGGGDRGDPEADFDGSGRCWLTDNADGNSDVDGGPTRLISPLIDASELGTPTLSYARWFTRDDDDGDGLRVEVSEDGGATWIEIEHVQVSVPSWVEVDWTLTDFVTDLSQIRVRFSATDNPNDSVVEAAIDRFRVGSFFCTEDPDPVPGDLDGNGTVDFTDIVLLLSSWGECVGCPADVDGDGTVGFNDLVVVLAAFDG